MIAFAITEIFFYSQPSSAVAVMAVREYGGGINPWKTAKVVTVTLAIPRTTAVLVEYTTAEQRCLGLHHLTERPFSGSHLYKIEQVCELVPAPRQTPFEVVVSKNRNLYILMGFSLDQDVKIVKAVWLDGTTQQENIKDGVIFFLQTSNTNAIRYIVGLDDTERQVTDAHAVH